MPELKIDLPGQGKEVFITVDATSRKGRILVMDDEIRIRDMLLQALIRSGYEVCLSSNGSEAVELYRSARQTGRPFHALIVDLCIKNGMNGLETIRSLLEIDPQVKAIVCSGSPNHPAMLDPESFGFRGVLPKPFSLGKLRAELDRVIQGRQDSLS